MRLDHLLASGGLCGRQNLDHLVGDRAGHGRPPVITRCSATIDETQPPEN